MNQTAHTLDIAPVTDDQATAESRVTPQDQAADVVAAIAADASTAPEAYLRATVVPEGGE